MRENNQAGGFTHTWTYDDAGNITSRKEYAYTTGELETPNNVVSYTYPDTNTNNAVWGDLLLSYNGKNITYDGVGNPLNDGTWDYTWEHGRQLASMSLSEDAITSPEDDITWDFTYNADGMRTSRTNGSTTYTYTYNGDKLTYLIANNHRLYFAYDANGIPMSMILDGVMYYYVTNVQGDVIGLVDSTGTEKVSYSYDAWGNPISTTGTLASTVGVLNPLRYRGYVYDQETKLYYLQSRYYNPEIGRFINADDTAYLGADGSLTSYNLFAYCGNNPVMGYDPTGHWDRAGVIIGLTIVAAAVITVATCGVGSVIGATIAAATITTGTTMTIAAATDSAMVVDVSVSLPTSSATYQKAGFSFVVDFGGDSISAYEHVGVGYGIAEGPSYSVGLVSNFDGPMDYSGHFVNVNAGSYMGYDHAWNPTQPYSSSTRSDCVTFSLSGRVSGGVEYNYYSTPWSVYW